MGILNRLSLFQWFVSLVLTDPRQLSIKPDDQLKTCTFPSTSKQQYDHNELQNDISWRDLNRSASKGLHYLSLLVPSLWLANFAGRTLLARYTSFPSFPARLINFRDNKYLTNLVFGPYCRLHILVFSRWLWPVRLGLGHKSAGKNSVRILKHGPRTRSVRDVYTFHIPPPSQHLLRCRRFLTNWCLFFPLDDELIVRKNDNERERNNLQQATFPFRTQELGQNFRFPDFDDNISKSYVQQGRGHLPRYGPLTS